MYQRSLWLVELLIAPFHHRRKLSLWNKATLNTLKYRVKYKVNWGDMYLDFYSTEKRRKKEEKDTADLTWA